MAKRGEKTTKAPKTNKSRKRAGAATKGDEVTDTASKINEWTVMFLFLGDSSLSPLIVSQLKAIKDAGFQEDTDVLVHFDPNEKGTPTRLYHVNHRRKKDPNLPNTMIGDGDDPFVRNLKDDIIDAKAIGASAMQALNGNGHMPQGPNTIKATDALRNFIGFCRKYHKAKHYILFLVGHGLIVGNDTFLPDDFPVSSITLRELDEVLRTFANDVADEGGAFELLALHSCSMSAVEVAYQLKGTANYMMASEGLSFVGSWPYRHLLKKVFKTIEVAKEDTKRNAKANGGDQAEAVKNPDFDIPELMEKLYYLSLFNSTDFMLSGYSSDLCLCNLSTEKVEALKGPIQELVARLREALNDERGKEMILLAHWESQSYWDEIYTDLFDFCRCLRKRCGDELKGLGDACEMVMQILKENESDNLLDRFNGLVVHSDHFGSKYQYSHGLSVYFPWSEPVADEPLPSVPSSFQGEQSETEQSTKSIGEGYDKNNILAKYKNYAFTRELEDDSKGSSWLSFLEDYFEKTKRTSRREEDGTGRTSENIPIPVTEFFDAFGLLNDKPGGAFNDKPSAATGLSCGCPSIKNYPTEEITPTGRAAGVKVKVKAFSISEDAFKALE